MTALIRPRPGEERCDFCHARLPEWRYPCESFTVTFRGHPMPGSTGAWLACQRCHELIQAEDWETLADRAVRGFEMLPPQVVEEVRNAIKRFHQAFNEHRTGPPTRWGRD